VSGAGRGGRYGMTAYVKDVMTLLLENRPEKPLEFIHDYLSNALQGRTQVVRAFRYIRLTKRSRQAFIDNLASAYAAMARSGEAAGGGLTGAEYLGLLKLLCDDFPAQIVASLVQVLDRRATGLVSFAEFAAGVNACLLYEEFLEHVLPRPAPAPPLPLAAHATARLACRPSASSTPATSRAPVPPAPRRAAPRRAPGAGW
jgi:hypothetical protein